MASSKNNENTIPISGLGRWRGAILHNKLITSRLRGSRA
jgi:hypothetical protein